MKVFIKNTEVESKDWAFKDDQGEQRSGTTRIQKATVDCDAYRKPIRIKLGDRPPYAPGEYTVDWEVSCKFTDAGDLVTEKQLVLVPFKKVT